VILVDANLLVYASVVGMRQHERSRVWLDERLNGSAPLALPWASLLAFLRLVSNPRVFERPRTIEDAWQQVEEWVACPPVWIPVPTDRHRDTLRGLLSQTSNRPNLVPDAHLAALAIEHGLTLCSTDGDFARFPGLRWEDPLRA
jgi:toxin-antitoxin system PIN domain toxin